MIIEDEDRENAQIWIWGLVLLPWVGGFLLWVAVLSWKRRTGVLEALSVALLVSFPAALVWRAVQWGRNDYPTWKLPLVEDTMLVSSHTAVGLTALGILVLGAVFLRTKIARDPGSNPELEGGLEAGPSTTGGQGA